MIWDPIFFEGFLVLLKVSIFGTKIRPFLGCFFFFGGVSFCGSNFKARLT